MIYFISDTHFGHENVLGYSKRPFKTVEEMDAKLIAEWNKRVTNTDQVYHLGDFSMRDGLYAERILKQLNGQIFLVRGNHDHKTIRKLSRFAWVKDYYELAVKEADKVQKIVLFHYPIESWSARHYGAWHLHGHCHGSLPSPDWQARLDVGVDVPPYNKPVSYEEVKQMMSTKTFKAIDHHQKKEIII